MAVPGASRSNLPAPLTSFLGRGRAVAEVRRLLGVDTTRGEGDHPVRLLTLTGLGGVGKTRLATEVAAGALDSYPDGAWLVDLAPLLDASLVSRSVAATLGLPDSPVHEPAQALADALRQRRALLLLDNCEHLVEECAALADVLLRACPLLQLLVTSRESLGLIGETVWLVPPLSLPPLTAAPVPRDVAAASEAVRLFAARAGSVVPGFDVTEQNAHAVAQLCVRLDGIPLAIELAAARARVLPVEQLVARLEDRFRILTGGSRTALPRHRSLQAMVDWSYDLLSEAERRVFERLAVFAGGWTLEAAEAVCGDDAFDLLAHLVDKSLVTVELAGGGPRYRLLETLRKYASAKLASLDQTAAIEHRHATYYVALAEAAEPHLTGAEQVAWLDRLGDEHDNLRTAVAWCIRVGEAELGLRLVGALCWYLMLRGHESEGRGWLQRLLLLPSAGETAARARALCCAGYLAFWQGDFAAARIAWDRSVAAGRTAGEPRSVARGLCGLGRVWAALGDLGGARSWLQQSRVVALEHGDRWGLGQALLAAGRLARATGDLATARARMEEALALFREVGDLHMTAAVLNNSARVAIAQGDPAARELAASSLALFRRVGHRCGAALAQKNLAEVLLHQGDDTGASRLLQESLQTLAALGIRADVARALEGLAAVAAARGEHDRALQLAAAGAALRAVTGAAGEAVEQRANQRLVRNAREALGAPAADRAWDAGRAMSLEQAIAYAIQAPTSPSERAPAGGAGAAVPPRWASLEARAAGLSGREWEVLEQVVAGASNRVIAARLHISPHTAAHHVASILGKLGATSRGEAAARGSASRSPAGTPDGQI